MPRSSVYYKANPRRADVELENAIIEEFWTNRGVYGTRKIKSALRRRKKPIIASRRRIGKIMKKHSLTSKYVLRRKKRKSKAVNEENEPNVVNQEFNGREPLEAVVSDLTYVKVGGVWHYVCLIIDFTS